MAMVIPSRLQLFALIFVWCQAGTGNASLLQWIWGGEKQSERVGDESSIEPNSMHENYMPPLVQYEGEAEDKRFTQEVKKYTQLPESEFDACHREVLVKLKASCMSATEEELSKLSVNLLNCHSQHGGKGIFPCTDKMTLRQCTQNMDVEMWTAYHVMNLKTRAMCYSARQLTLHYRNRDKVNQLAEATRLQLSSMWSVKVKQEVLENVAYGTKDLMSKTQDVLHLHVEELDSMHEELNKLFGLKILDLIEIKTLAEEGRKHFVNYATDVKENLESIHEKLERSAKAKKDDYSEILSAMKNINKMVESTLKLTDSQVTNATGMVSRLTKEREEALDVLSGVASILDPFDRQCQLFDSFLAESYPRVEDKGKRLGLFLSIVWHLLVVLGSIGFCSLSNAGFLSQAFSFAVYGNLLVMYFCGADSAVKLYVIAVVFVCLRAVQWFVTCLYNFLKKSSDDEVGSIYMLDDNDAFVSVHGDKGSSSPKDVTEGVFDKLWLQLKSLFKRKEYTDEPYKQYNGCEDDIRISDDDSVDEIGKSNNHGYMSWERGSSVNRQMSPVTKELSSPLSGQRRYELRSSSLQRTPTPLRQSPDRRSQSPAGLSKPLCSAANADGTKCRNGARYGCDVCFLHSKLSSVRHRML